jgi:hypothetical protein
MAIGGTRADPGDRRFGLLHPALDVHVLGISSIEGILRECGIRVASADREVCEAAAHPDAPESGRILRRWVLGNGIDSIGFSYRLDPDDGLRFFSAFWDFLDAAGLRTASGGPVASVYFAGLPRTCELVHERFPSVDGLFCGDESPAECLDLLAVPRRRFPSALAAGTVYDEARMAFGREIVRSGRYRAVGAVDRSSSPRFGERGDGIAARIAHGTARSLPPLIRAHAGPYLPDRHEAVELFIDWAARLAKGGLLDVLSIGSSQLCQSRFGEDWTGLVDGGGVPLASPEEYGRVWEAARPMLVRTYAGTKDVPALARMYEERIDIAWHALSLWWFCAIDGRGPNSVMQNLLEHEATLSYIASTGKPFEPNVPHHFAFRGADDATFVASGYVAARVAKAAGIRALVLQIMLNTPKSTWGVQDLAKARALLGLVRSLEDGSFKVYLQPRAGLDYFSHDTEKAKAQLAASTALMDDIEPGDDASPQIVHVVSYSEAQGLADPPVIEESIKIARYALFEYRARRRLGQVPNMAFDAEAKARTEALMAEARAVIAAIESSVDTPYSARGLYEILASGFFPVPHLSELRDELSEAVRWRTALVGGGVEVVDPDGAPIPAADRMREVADVARRRAAARAASGTTKPRQAGQERT